MISRKLTYHFSALSDGNRDPTNTENIFVVVRYVKESLIDMPITVAFDAEGLASLILETLN